METHPTAKDLNDLLDMSNKISTIHDVRISLGRKGMRLIGSTWSSTNSIANFQLHHSFTEVN